MWPGIEVWGNSSANQLEVGGSYAQGYVEMRNGATVENAMCALSLWRPEHWGTTGGIVHAEDAVFRNNTKSVHALLYSNLSISGRELNYNSHFHNCSFSVDEDYVGTEPFSMHVHLYKVNGINFSGCSFSVDPEADGVQSWCSGIQADNAGVIVTSYCDYGNQGPAPQPCPDEDLVRSSFTGFHAGVKTTSDGTTAYPFTVRDSDFSYNDRGIYALNTGYGIILNNTFSIGRDADCAFGVYADRVTSFLIEENSFAAGDPDIETYGIGIFNSNAGNDVYLNSFDRLTCGNLAVGTNSSNTAHQGDTNYDGLTYTCNQNSSNGIDFCVLKDGGSGGVKPVQGSPSAPAGNTFDGSGFLFYNDGDWVVDYYYKSGDPDQTPSSSLLHRVNSVASTGQNNCLSHTGTVTKSPQEIAGLENDYLEARNIHANLLRLYESRIDGGSTAAEVADLRSATPSDQPRLRAKLLNHSPYLSQEALTVAADRDDVFSDPVLFEILAANPDELKKDTLISYLEHKASPLPTYMTDMLRMIAEGTTVRTTLVAQMDKYRHDWRTAAGDIVRSILNDSVADPAELRLWLGHMDDIASDRMAVASYVQEGDFGSAIGLAGTLPGVYGLDGDAVLDHRDYMRLLSLLRIIYESGRNTLQMTESELDTVTGIAESGTGTSQSMAQAMIESVTGTRGMRYDCPRLPAVRGTAKGFPGVDRTEIPGFCLAFSPNPVRTQATVDYTLPDNAEKAVLELFNALGVKVASLELEGNAGNKQISLEGLSPGIYSYSVRCGKHALNGKIVVE